MISLDILDQVFGRYARNEVVVDGKRFGIKERRGDGG